MPAIARGSGAARVRTWRRRNTILANARARIPVLPLTSLFARVKEGVRVVKQGLHLTPTNNQTPLFRGPTSIKPTTILGMLLAATNCGKIVYPGNSLVCCPPNPSKLDPCACLSGEAAGGGRRAHPACCEGPRGTEARGIGQHLPRRPGGPAPSSPNAADARRGGNPPRRWREGRRRQTRLYLGRCRWRRRRPHCGRTSGTWGNRGFRPAG